MQNRLLARSTLAILLLIGLIGLAQPHLVPQIPAPYDKILHFSIFGLATFLASLSFERIIIAVFFALMIFLGGVALEVIQSMEPDRHAEFADVATNFFGVVCAFLLSLSFRKKNQENQRSNSMNGKIIELYKHERDIGTPLQERLEKAARLYRQEFPETPPMQARLIVSEILEGM